jgi:PAS domain S-box-containing protein
VTTFPPDGNLSDWLTLKDRALDVAAEGITIADAQKPDRPLIYVNHGFERMTGYTASEVIGRNCRFLQGKDTDPAAADEIRTALNAGRECVVEILNYRRDGVPFWNRLSITPVRDAIGRLTHFIGVQSDVTARRRAEEALRRSRQALDEDLRLAARVQRSLLPPPEVRAGTLHFAHAFHPCDALAGDAVGIVPLPDGGVGIYILDVSGHGVAASLLSFTLAHLLSPGEGALVTENLGERAVSVPPVRIAERLNRQFPMDRTQQYFTLIYGIAAPGTGVIEYVVAGHPAPVLVPRGGSPAPVAGGGRPVGILEDTRYEPERLTMEAGDRLYFYTDGVVEARDAAENEFGLERLIFEIGQVRDLPLRAGIDRVASAVTDWCRGSPADDVSLLAIERTALDPSTEDTP